MFVFSSVSGGSLRSKHGSAEQGWGTPDLPRAEAGGKDPLEIPSDGGEEVVSEEPRILTREGVSFSPGEQDILSRKVKSKPSSSHCVSSCPSVSPLLSRHVSDTEEEAVAGGETDDWGHPPFHGLPSLI